MDVQTLQFGLLLAAMGAAHGSPIPRDPPSPGSRRVEGTLRTLWTPLAQPKGGGRFKWTGGVFEIRLWMPEGLPARSWNRVISDSCPDLRRIFDELNVDPFRLGAGIDPSDSWFSFDHRSNQPVVIKLGGRQADGLARQAINAIDIKGRAASIQLALALQLRAMLHDQRHPEANRSLLDDWVATGQVDYAGRSSDVAGVLLKALHSGIWGASRGRENLRFLFPAENFNLLEFQKTLQRQLDEMRADFAVRGAAAEFDGMCIQLLETPDDPAGRCELTVVLDPSHCCRVSMIPVDGLAHAEEILFGAPPRSVRKPILASLLAALGVLVLVGGGAFVGAKMLAGSELSEAPSCSGIDDDGTGEPQTGGHLPDDDETASVTEEPPDDDSAETLADARSDDDSATDPTGEAQLEPPPFEPPEGTRCDNRRCKYYVGDRLAVHCRGTRAFCERAVYHLVQRDQVSRTWDIFDLELHPEWQTFYELGKAMRIHAEWEGANGESREGDCPESEEVVDRYCGAAGLDVPPEEAVERILDACIEEFDVNPAF